jgi:uncharacterized protein YceH (UPF0502 family)
MDPLDPLDPVAARVLGSLIEKEFATPDNYPLTLKSLTAACNQSSNRDPVMDLDETAVMRGLDALTSRTWARGVHRGDARVMRYREEIGETLHLHRPELAILAVLLLRGPQTVGEIKARTHRLAEFVDLSHVEITLDTLATLSTPLVTGLPRQPGQKEVRWAHLLGGTPEVVEPEAAEPAEEPRPDAPGDRRDALELEVAALRDEVAALREQFEAFRKQFE